MRLLHNSIYLKVPSYEELKYTEELLSDEETMRFNEKWGGTVPFPKEKWQKFYDRFTEDEQVHYFHIYNLEGVFVGEVSSRYDLFFSSYVLNIKVMYRYRGNKHAYDALEKFLEYLFDEVGIDKIVDNVGHDSKAGLALLRQFGFMEIDQTDEYVLLELRKEDF